MMASLNALNNLEGVVTCQCRVGLHGTDPCGGPLESICVDCGLGVCHGCAWRPQPDDGKHRCVPCGRREYFGDGELA